MSKSLSLMPRNEQGTVFAFSQACASTEWSLVDIRTGYPDAIAEYRGERWRVEFEFKSSNFITHGHDIRDCDIIVCWEHDYEDCPIPVICLQDDLWTQVEYVKSNPLAAEVEYWKRRAMMLQGKLVKTREMLEFDEEDGKKWGIVTGDDSDDWS